MDVVVTNTCVATRELQLCQDSIVLIVSHSGGTFAPLAISNLMQSMTSNIFAVTSEWDRGLLTV